ncbi:hypothetical protein [Oceanimonas marisflavi]|uniref:hypothetical protein n=1 Tax=Oceanimonas marisflavi TaxID=2059724 RepID=UPI000D30E821|nr:hypothetical protein [Oceanimonas marisflavi]
MSCFSCRRWCALRLLLLLVLSTAAHASSPRWLDITPGDPGIYIRGRVHYVNLEGGLYIIRDMRGTYYHPINLPIAFQQDGLAIEALARQRDISQLGIKVELLRIRRASRLK